MQVRIVKCSINSWYNDQIGSTINVEDMGMNYFGFSTSEATYYIEKTDCEILPEENQPEPFDLERALKGDKVITRDGDEGVFMFTNPHSYDGDKHLFQFSINNSDNKYVLVFNGSYWVGGFTGIKHDSSIFMVPRESEYVTKWVNLYAVGCATWDHSQQEAIDSSVRTGYRGHIGTFPITFKRPS